MNARKKAYLLKLTRDCLYEAKECAAMICAATIVPCLLFYFLIKLSHSI